MLALKTVLSAADEVPTLIFDEIDVGIGGRVGSVVGQKLWNLTTHKNGNANGATSTSGTRAERAHQVICITHLPQIAAYGDLHYRVDKVISGERTSTAVRSLTGDERVSELAQMLGAAGEAGEQSAAEILHAAEKSKS